MSSSMSQNDNPIEVQRSVQIDQVRMRVTTIQIWCDLSNDFTVNEIWPDVPLSFALHLSRRSGCLLKFCEQEALCEIVGNLDINWWHWVRPTGAREPRSGQWHHQSTWKRRHGHEGRKRWVQFLIVISWNGAGEMWGNLAFLTIQGYEISLTLSM